MVFGTSITSWLFFFFFNDTATTEIYTLSLHDALPILDRETGQEKPQTRLERERGSHELAWRQLAHRGRELRRVRDHGDAPDEEQRDQQGEGVTERETCRECARARQRHRHARDQRATPAITVLPAQPAPQRAAPDHRECDERRRAAPGRSTAGAGELARRDERSQPRPHRVQLPHVTQVAEVRERYRTVREDAWRDRKSTRLN